jgi:hypothetical protein
MDSEAHNNEDTDTMKQQGLGLSVETSSPLEGPNHIDELIHPQKEICNTTTDFPSNSHKYVQSCDGVLLLPLPASNGGSSRVTACTADESDASLSTRFHPRGRRDENDGIEDSDHDNRRNEIESSIIETSNKAAFTPDCFSVMEESTSNTTLSSSRPARAVPIRNRSNISNISSRTDSVEKCSREMPASVSTLTVMEADLQTKTRARNDGREGSVPENGTRLDGNILSASALAAMPPSTMNRMEDDLLSKAQVGMTPATRPGAVYVPSPAPVGPPGLSPSMDRPGSLSMVEQDMLHKRLVVENDRADTATDTTEANSSARSVSSRPNPSAMLSLLDERIAAKTRIPSRGEGSVATAEAYSIRSVTSGGRQGTAALQSTADIATLRNLEEQIANKTNGGLLLSHFMNMRHRAGGTSLANRSHDIVSFDAGASSSASARISRSSVLGFKEREEPLDRSVEMGNADTDSMNSDQSSDEFVVADDRHNECGDVNQGRSSLAVAIPVGNSNSALTEEADSDGNRSRLAPIPSAVEYDPTFKSIYKNRYFAVVMFVICLILVAIVTFVAIICTQDNSDSGVANNNTSSSGGSFLQTSAPSCERCNLGIEEHLETLVGASKLSDTSSPYYQAMEWIIHDDPLQLVFSSTRSSNCRFHQRFMLATFYFDTHQDGQEWNQCNRKTEVDDDPICLFSWQSGDTPVEMTKHRWLSETHECTWAGLLCDESEEINKIFLIQQGIVGTIPTVLTLLPQLQEIDFSFNELEGSIPPEFGSIKDLVLFSVDANLLTGPVPSEWANSDNLRAFNVASNLLTGTLPPEIKNLNSVSGLYLQDNLFTGTFPKEIFELSSLCKWSCVPPIFHIMRLATVIGVSQ